MEFNDYIMSSGYEMSCILQLWREMAGRDKADGLQPEFSAGSHFVNTKNVVTTTPRRLVLLLKDAVQTSHVGITRRNLSSVGGFT
jgi:hypothetical protein